MVGCQASCCSLEPRFLVEAGFFIYRVRSQSPVSPPNDIGIIRLFNPQTTIKYDLPEPTPVTLRVFDIAGRLVDVLVEGEDMPAGTHTATWTGRDSQGRAMPSGTYVYRLEADGFVETRRMTLIR